MQAKVAAARQAAALDSAKWNHCAATWVDTRPALWRVQDVKERKHEGHASNAVIVFSAEDTCSVWRLGC